ncbi:DNA N-6-adenine-methyltransferase [Terasakiella sp. SH-1]|uniref:DNA N-6-adenine-methyltransferase n=1 Tax=Terasakiella sp. SH-1 TaxID=2560057 RepID=UPI001430E032|nr:DNA N-6-adenine-methyltransferase [Terasakiella sp. SH-1]
MEKKFYHKCLGQQLAQFRKNTKTSHVVLSKNTGISRPTLRNIELGKGNLANFIQIMQTLDLDISAKKLPTTGVLGKRIALLRKSQNISQRKLAELVGVSHPTIVSLETKNSGRLDVLNTIFSHLNTKPIIVPINSDKNFWNGAAMSNKSDEWYSPPSILEKLYTCINGEFDLDPSSPLHCKPVEAHKYYTIEDDGLQQPWNGKVFLNPPYSANEPWCRKARESVENGDAECVIALLAARTDTGWWHRQVAGHADVFLLQGRLKFSNQPNSAPFPSCLVVWGGDDQLKQSIRAAFNAHHISSYSSM